MLHSQAYEIKSKQTLLKKMKYTDLALLSYLAIRKIISISQEETVQRLPESQELELIREQGNTSFFQQKKGNIYIIETQGANTSCWEIITEH